MDALLQDIVGDDPYVKLAYNNDPVPHFVMQSPNTPIVDWNVEAGVVQVDQIRLYNHVSTFEYSNIPPNYTERGTNRKWQLFIDLATDQVINHKLDEEVLPMDEFFSTREFQRMWEFFIRPAAYNYWFPILDIDGKALATKVKVTLVRDALLKNSRYTHPYDVSDNNVILSAMVAAFITPNLCVNLKKGDSVSKNYYFIEPGYGVVTAPQKHPHEFKLRSLESTRPDEENLTNGIAVYILFEFIE